MVVQIFQNSTVRVKFSLKMYSTKMLMQPQINGQNSNPQKHSVYKKYSTHEKHSIYKKHSTYEKHSKNEKCLICKTDSSYEKKFNT